MAQTPMTIRQGMASGRLLEVIPDTPLQPQFEGLVADARTSIAKLLEERLDSLYLYGSVARACARTGHSDLDLTIVLARPLSTHESADLEQLRLDLQRRHSEVVKIDFDLGTRQQVLDPAHRYSWGYWLRHECRCIHGTDLGRQFARFRPSRAIAEAVNGDYVQELDGYLLRMADAHEAATAQRLQKEAARKLLRATNVLRPYSGGPWPRTLEEFAALFAGRHPGMASQVHFFLAQALAPDAPQALFGGRLFDFLNWMQEQQRASNLD